MTYLIACVCLMIIAGVAIWARRPETASADTADTPETPPDFTLRRAVLLFGPQMNDPQCSAQRTELKRILGPLLEGGYRIVEVYGTSAPTQNGEVYDWLDNQLLRGTLNAKSGFHLIFVDDAGQTLFHAAQPVTAEALLHIFDLWHHIEGAAGEALAETVTETASQHVSPAPAPADIEKRAPAVAASAPEARHPYHAAQSRKASLPPATVTVTGPGLASQLKTLEMMAAQARDNAVPAAANEADAGEPAARATRRAEPRAAAAGETRQRPRAPSHIKELLKRRRA